MHWFRKARIAAALLVVVVTAVGLLTQVGERPLGNIVAAYAMLAGALGLLVLFVWADERVPSW